ncbi:zinc finger protein VAR3, chloroplastic isoform X2 [Ziziphus jujuba]|uniref:Zinc finger protein VAR3, chloroplastic isoform X2 n=1 Tax=Ziziphus jujuba TaxID=326968 RepID=A0ABM3IJT7_ZIZJJ|nr:zinc finger protein VAR3, chloroplastic isoform X2 [Ziziphus jujuba]
MSATSRFLHFGTALVRFPRALSPAPAVLFANSFTLSQKSLRFPRYCSSAAVDTITADSSAVVSHHPWPEWVAFVDRLKSKGYFNGSSCLEETENVYKDMNLLKDACMGFARDRYDIFKSLSAEDIEKVVGSGCPNLLRKAVNSAKRLRAHVRLDEGDVCSACNLRGSCDRAYVILKDFEANARTVDIVRILLIYALDPLVVSGEAKPLGKELVESSARKLLSELLELSETSIDPGLPKPADKVSKNTERSFSLMDAEPSVEMKRGDWMCPKCNFLNFSKNLRCLKCNEDGPKRVGPYEVEMKKGDWNCPECNFMNFSRNIRCLKCKAEGPKKVSVDFEMKKGDWNCPKCEFMNFASNRKCLRCREPRPKRQLNPGEWECPSCDFLNYRRNKVCLKCNCNRPEEEATNEYEDDQLWRRPH